MSEPKIDWAAVIATWSITKLEVEIDQAMASASDESLTDDFRTSSLCAASMMATELVKKRRAVGRCGCGQPAKWLLLGESAFCERHKGETVGFEVADWSAL